MKKVFAILAATVLFAGMASAQLGINVGYAPQTFKSTYTNGNNSNTTTTSMTGFFAGVNYNTALTGDLNLSVGLQGRFNTSSDTTAAGVGALAGASVENHNTQLLLDVPVLFNYGFNLSSAAKLSVFVGPTVSYALSGKTKTVTTVTVLGNTTTNENETNWYGDNSNRKNLDVSATLGAVLSYNQFRIFGGYNMGLLNLTSADNTTLKASNVFFGVGMAL